MKRASWVLTLVALFSLLLAGCGNKAKTDPLDTLDRAAPYTATLPSVTTHINPGKAEKKDTVLIGTVTGVSTSVNIRSEASTSGTVLGTAQNGEKFIVTEKNAYEGWHRIDYNGQTAFIYAEYLTVSEGTMDLLSAPSDAAGIVPTE